MRRLSTGVALLCLLVPALAGCGSDDNGGSEETGSVSVSGAFGEAPKVTYDAPYTVTKVSSEVLEKGDGETVEDGDFAFINLYIGNGFTGKEASSSWTAPDPEPTATETPDPSESPSADDGKQKKGDNKKGKKGKKEGDTEGALSAPIEDPTPEMVQISKETTLKPIYDAIAGHQVGSRVLVSAPGEDAFGLGGADYNIGNADTTVFVVDIVARAAATVDSSGAVQPKNAPSVIESDGKVTGLDFADAPKKAGDKLRVETLVQGDGTAIAKGDQVALRYLGQVWGKKKVFDTNWDADVPGVGGRPATIADGGLIEGWVKGLVGVKAGSRVMLIIPSDLGYGDKGSGKDIKPGDDLVFVIDVLGVA
ncbi:FKBP-type peptidyl-prolyl cis-trans isomerase [Nocardioides daejeonensis]|uniref:FKBP-type peptidyl-prolyl cis-trans isomerase n=1 Tax=Nocardioides daejeonensis TaxID=1046556 RepID=UPI000D747BDA|nr:FKBP-type peptidyl-prolyl cis-trans isomerase [Nocardioides daejeonensis]